MVDAKRILILSHMYPNFINSVYGIFVHEQAKELLRQGIDVVVVSPKPVAPFFLGWVSEKWNHYGRILAEERLEGIPVYRPRYLSFPRNILLGCSGRLMYLGIRKLLHEIRSHFPFDLIHAHVAVPDGYCAALVSRKIGVPFIVTIHGLDVCSCAPNLPTIERSKACRKAVLRTFEHASRIVGVSSVVACAVERYYPKKEKIRFIGNGIPHERLQNPEDIPNSSSAEPLILSVGYLNLRKGFDLVIKALPKIMKSVPEIQYIILGDGEEREKLKRLASELGVAERVNFLGKVSQDHVYHWMKKADVFVLPSWDEAFGVVYIEAMAVGTPVIGCKGQGAEDIIINGESGILVRPKNVDDVAEAIIYLLLNHDIRSEMSKKACKRVGSHFLWSENVRKYRELYNEVLC